MADEQNGSNSSGMTEAERRAVFFEHYREIAAQTAVVERERDSLKTLRKKAKVAGLMLSDVDFALKAAGDNGSEIVGRLAREVEVARWFNLPLGQQADLFAVDNKSELERAYEKGVLASALNKNGNPELDGYLPGTEEGQEWLRGHGDDRKSRMKALAEVLSRSETGGGAAEGGEPVQSDPQTETPVSEAEKPKKQPRKKDTGNVVPLNKGDADPLDTDSPLAENGKGKDWHKGVYGGGKG